MTALSTVSWIVLSTSPLFAASGGTDPALRPAAGLGPTVQSPAGAGPVVPVSIDALVDFEDLNVAAGSAAHYSNGICVTSGGFKLCPGPLNAFNDMHAGNGFSSYAYNGTTILCSHDDFIVSRADGTPATMTQFDFAGFPGGIEPPFQVTALPSGTVAHFTPDGVVDGSGSAPDFETFTLPAGFTGTSFVFVTSGGSSVDDIISFDNICFGPSCGVTFGAGCPGSGGFVPELTQTACDPSGQVAFEIQKAPGGATALLLFGLTQASTPIGLSGCSLNVGTLLPLSVAIPLGGSGPGAGSVLLPGVLPPSASGLTFTMTAAISDATTVLGFTTTNGIEVTAP